MKPLMEMAKRPLVVATIVLLLSVSYRFARVLSLQYIVDVLQDALMRQFKKFRKAIFQPIFFAVAATAVFYYDYSSYNCWYILTSDVWKYILPLPLTLHQGKKSRMIGIPIFAFFIAVVDAVRVFRDPTSKFESLLLASVKNLIQPGLDFLEEAFSQLGENMLPWSRTNVSWRTITETLDTSEESTTRLLLYIILLVELLLAAGVCVSYALARFFHASQHDGDELRDATRSNDVLGVKLLIARGMNPNACSGDGTTALHVCGQQAMNRVACFLLEQGADVNVRDRLGLTPLHWAVQMRREEISPANRLSIIRTLLQHGADPRKPDASGITPLQIACRKENEASLGVLKDFLPGEEVDAGQAEITDMIDVSAREIYNSE
ncbi:putative ankyrin repeat-containing domain-containing protein [Plasmopara halstedii]